MAHFTRFVSFEDKFSTKYEERQIGFFCYGFYF